jgi:tetratricopeptide (TPR) repeat protein
MAMTEKILAHTYQRVTRWTVALLAVLATVQSTAAERAWHRLDAEHYRVFSQLGDRDTVAWAHEFDQFIASMSGMLHIDSRLLPPLTVVLFARDQDFEPYKTTKPNGRTANVDGEFVRQKTWSVIGMAGGRIDDELRQLIFHEATHWLMSVDEARQPAWFAEGIAELFSTYEVRGDKINWAKPIGQHLATLRDAGTMSLRDFLTQPSAIFDRDERTERFYAQAWAFTHFLLYSGDPERAKLLTQFLDTFKSHSGAATVDEVFGATLPALDHEFRLYIDKNRFGYTIAPVVPTSTLPAPVPASPESVQAALGFLALGAERTELAKDHAYQAIRIEPLAPGGHEILAYESLQHDDFDAATRHAEDALDAGSKDSAMYMLLAYSFINGPNADRPNALRQRMSLFERAINLNPRRVEPYERLAEALFEAESPTDDDVKFLNLGLKVFPGDDWLKVGAAAAAFRQGRREDAAQAMEHALLAGSTLDDEQRKYANTMLHSLLLQQQNEDLQHAIGQHDTTAARSIVQQMLAQPDLPQDMRQYLEKVLASLNQPEPPPARKKK